MIFLIAWWVNQSCMKSNGFLVQEGYNEEEREYGGWKESEY